MFIGCSVISTSIGASSTVITSCDDEPMCRHTTVPSSLHACQNGSQCSVWKLGQPSFAGFSENVTAWQPFAATRRTSSAISCGSHIGGSDERDEAARVRAAPLVDVPVVVGLQHARGRRPCPSVRLNSWPQNCGKRREAHRAEHAVGVHVLDALVDVVATGPHLVERRRLDAVLLGRAAGDRVEPDVRAAPGPRRPRRRCRRRVCDDLRRQVLVLRRQAAVEHVGRLDHVVVDADTGPCLRCS